MAIPFKGGLAAGFSAPGAAVSLAAACWARPASALLGISIILSPGRPALILYRKLRPRAVLWSQAEVFSGLFFAIFL